MLLQLTYADPVRVRGLIYARDRRLGAGGRRTRQAEEQLRHGGRHTMRASGAERCALHLPISLRHRSMAHSSGSQAGRQLVSRERPR